MRIELTTEIDGKKVIGLEGIKQQADEGNIEALNLLGEWLLTGFECSPDVNYAFGCFKKAARAGNTQAMLNLGLCYIEGHGTAKNFYAAERWIRAADELGDEEAEGVCEELYLTSIGSHKPSLRALVDYIYSKHPKGNVSVDEEFLKKEMITHLILQEFGKTDEEIEALKGKVTENDIIAYESMNDLYYDDSDDSDADFELDRTQYIQSLLVNIESHHSVLLDEHSRNNKTKTQVIPIDLWERKNIATYLRLLYHLSKKSNKTLRKNLLAIGIPCDSELTVEDELSWYERAMFDIVPEMLGTFSEEELRGCVAAISDYWLVIQTQELTNAFDKNGKDQGQLRSLQTQISKSRQFEKALIDEWTKKISDRLYELDMAMLSELYDEAGTDYEKLVGLYKRISDNTFETKAKSEWLKKTTELLKTVQTDILEKICGSISGMDYDALVLLYEDTKNKYTFNRDILDKYLAIIVKPIDEYEISVLDKICDNTDNLSSNEYAEIIKKIEGLNFKASNKQKYLDDISKKLKNAKVLESCEERYLEDYDLDQLNDRIRAIHFSTFPAEIKAELSQRITYYIDLIYECKDKQTVKLLSDCEPENIVNFSIAELLAKKELLQEHIRLSPTIKEELLARVETQIRIKEFDRKYVAAGNDYNLLMSAKKSLSSAKLPEDEVRKYEALLSTKIVDAQRKALSELTADIDKKQHSQIKKAIASAKEFAFDKDILDEALATLETALDAAENQTLQEICANLDHAALDDIPAMREQIRKCGFKKENTAPYITQLDARHNELYYINLVRQCTAEILAGMSVQDLVELRKELEAYVSQKDDAQQYVDRVQSVTEATKRYNKALVDLSKQYIPAIIDAASASVKSLYQRVTEYYRPEIYVQGEKFLEEHKKDDIFRSQYAPDVERQIFGVYQLNGSKATPSLSITNLCAYAGKRKIPVESIVQVKAVMLVGGVSLVTATETINVHTELPYGGKVHLATAISEIVNYVTNCKRSMQAPLAQIESTFKAEFSACFGGESLAEASAIVQPQVTEPTIEQPQSVATPAITNTAQASMAATPVETGVDRLNKAVAQSLEAFKKPITELTPIQISNALSALTIKYPNTRYITYRTEEFEKKIGKAISAYASIRNGETALMMEDQTIFGSAKEGFVLTNRNIYINTSGCKNKVIALDSVTNVYCRRSTSLTDVLISTTAGEFRFTYRSSDEDGNSCAACLKEAIVWLNGSPVETTHSQAAQVQAKWLCQCGNVNDGNFCSTCGGRKEAGVVLWQCACGSLNKGKFCSKCGSPKKE